MTRQQLLASALAAMTAMAPVAAGAQIFGESDEVKAARQAHEDGQDAQITQLQGRIQQLEDKVRGLTDSLAQATGNNENLAHQLDVMGDKLERQNRDFTYRLCTLSAQQMGADQSSFNCANGGTPGAAQGFSQSVPAGTPLPPVGAGGGDGTQSLGRPPGILGTLPSGNPPTQLSSAVPLPPATGGAGDFDTAMNLLAKAQYAEASAGFRSYADNHPDDTDLSPKAIYWIGQIKYVQQDYPGASHDFAELIKKYPNSSRAPDAMLKLGQSQLAMGQKPEGCIALGALKAKFPDAPDGTVAAAAAARKAAACSR
jgi:tol-pal system protein YbgF